MLGWYIIAHDVLPTSALPRIDSLHLVQGDVKEREQFIFVPVSAETSGVFGKLGYKLLKEIGHKITEATGEKHATSYLFRKGKTETAATKF